MANKEITCGFSDSYGWNQVYAKVDANGLPYTRAISPRYGDSGYVAGFKTTVGGGLVGTTAIMSVDIGGASGGQGLSGSQTSYGCSAKWPLT